MYGVFYAVVTALADKVGHPYNLLPLGMMRYGEGGVVGWGSLCGALNGGCAAINLVADEKSYKKLVHELVGWYTEFAFPSDISNEYASKHEFLVAEYKTDQPLPSSVSGSTLCHVSVTNWCQASGYASGSKERSERCARLSGDVAAKVVDLLNQHYDATFEPVFAIPAEAETCRACHHKGKEFEKGQFTRGKENCLLCHEPHGFE